MDSRSSFEKVPLLFDRLRWFSGSSFEEDILAFQQIALIFDTWIAFQVENKILPNQPFASSFETGFFQVTLNLLKQEPNIL